MKPLTWASSLLIRWTEWLDRACYWRRFNRRFRRDNSHHCALVAAWAKADYNQWRAVTFP